MKAVIGKHGISSWPIEKRLERLIFQDPISGCWIWAGATQKSGHGRMTVNKVCREAHRVVYEIHMGKIPPGLVLDHLCRNPSCVNPSHLEPVTQRENLMRAETVSAINSRKTHCKRGHELSGGNLKISTTGARVCVACKRIRDKKYKQERKNHAF